MIQHAMPLPQPNEPIPQVHAGSLRLRLVGPSSDDRQPIERFIHACFAHSYRADVRWFMPYLIQLREASSDVPVAAMGYRFADCGPLFLESYLDTPVETVLGRPRSEILELGNLAAVRPGMLRWMILVLEVFLHELGGGQVVFTGSARLANSFRRLGVSLTKIAEADPSRIPDAARFWGSYYQHRPAVFTGRLDRARPFRETRLPSCRLYHQAVESARLEALRLGRMAGLHRNNTGAAA
ncbi:MAG: thermostable hemolysin [Chromatiales bacterium]|nr:thermostable hemolysin [Chromatiales bacterium]